MTNLPVEIVVVLEDHTVVLEAKVSEIGLVGPSSGAEVLTALNDHISAAEPHPVYDDGTSYLLRYQNAKV